jgi:hypothetical protein
MRDTLRTSRLPALRCCETKNDLNKFFHTHVPPFCVLFFLVCEKSCDLLDDANRQYPSSHESPPIFFLPTIPLRQLLVALIK